MRNLLWKEWREVRMFAILWPLLALLALLAFRVVSAFLPAADAKSLREGSEALVLTMSSLMWPFLAALVSGHLFASEASADTLRFTTALPVSRWRLWWAKTLAGFSAMIAAILITLLLVSPLFFFAAKPQYHSEDLPGYLGGVIALTWLIFFPAQLCSVLSRKPINAGLGGLLLAGAAVFAAYVDWRIIHQIATVEVEAILPCLWGLWLLLLIPVISGLVFARDGVDSGKRGVRLAVALLVGSYLLFALCTFVLPSVRVVGISARAIQPNSVNGVTVSPTSREVIVSTYNPASIDDGDNLWLLNTLSGKIRWIDVGSLPSFSPNGKEIAFASTRGIFGLRRWDGAPKLWIYNVGSGRLRKVSLPEGKGFNAVFPPVAWSPDSGRFLVTRFVSKPIPAREWIVKWFQGPEAWHDAAYMYGTYSVWIVSTLNEPPRRVQELPEDQELEALGWSSDGSKAYVTSFHQLYQVRMHTCAAESIGPKRPTSGDIKMAANSPRFLWHESIDRGDILKLMGESGTDVKTIPLPRHAERIALSPDGNYLAFVINDKSGGVSIVDLRRTMTTIYAVEQLIRYTRPTDHSEPIRASFIAWSPDSRRIAFNDESYGGRLLVEDVHNGGASVLIGRDAGIIRFIRWFGKDRLLYCLQSGEIFMVNTDGGGLRKIFPPRKEGRG